jgi:hypothetical protein
MARLVALIAVAALVVAPAPALAQGNPFAPPPVPEQPIVPQPAPAPERPGDDNLSSGEMVAIALALLVGLTLLGVLIVRDARRRVPRRERRHAAVGADGGGGRRATRPAPRGRKPSPAERKRRKRGRAR